MRTEAEVIAYCNTFSGVYQSVVPGYHLNKEHWNSVILDESVKREDIEAMIQESYELTKAKR